MRFYLSKSKSKGCYRTVLPKTGLQRESPTKNAAWPASLPVEFTVEIHSIPHSNSALITDENMFYGVC